MATAVPVIGNDPAVVNRGVEAAAFIGSEVLASQAAQRRHDPDVVEPLATRSAADSPSNAPANR